jgi:hypothetical protein
MNKRHRAFVAQVPMVGGKPDLDLPEEANYWAEWPGRLWHLSWNTYYAVILKLGMYNGDAVIVGAGDNKILLGLQHLGAKVYLLKDAWSKPAVKAWLLANGMTEKDGKPVAPIMYSGDNAWQMGDDYPSAP